jgi:sulfur relay protein TusB/DsrH
LTVEHSNGSCLHLLLSKEPASLVQCKAACHHNDSIVLADMAVQFLLEAEVLNEGFASSRICCLEADLKAQGLSETHHASDVTVITDADLIDMLYQHQHCLSWK